MRLALSVLAGASAILFAQPALPCGGLVHEVGSQVAAYGQIVFYAVGAAQTDMVVQVSVLDADSDYGFVIPLPVEPTIDPTPLDVDALIDLEWQTQPTITVDYGDNGGGGCGCGGAALPGDNLGGGDGVNVHSVVNVGSMTATVVSGTTGTALTDWLSAEGFSVSATDAAVFDSYVDAGAFFVALRSTTEAGDNPAPGLGLHLTMPGQQTPGYALRLSRIGVGDELAVTVFVVADESVAPALPFDWFTIDALSAETLLYLEDYAAAVRERVDEANGKAFVVEAVTDIADLDMPAGLAAFVGEGQVLTRMSTIIAASDLEEDVAFTDNGPETVPSSRVLSSTEATVGVIGLAALLFALARGAALLKRRGA